LCSGLAGAATEPSSKWLRRNGAVRQAGPRPPPRGTGLLLNSRIFAMADDRQDQKREAGILDSHPAPRPSATGLGASEAYAFWRGMRDSPRTLGIGLFTEWVLDVFAIKQRPILRDPRLEAIRRLTVCFRTGLTEQLNIELPSARRAGVTENQIAALRHRARQPLFARS
jgi:hypothetical protein